MRDNPSTIPSHGFGRYGAGRKILKQIKKMSRQCAITGKSSKVAGNYSNRVRATQFNPTHKKRRHANLQKKRVYVPELKKFITLTLSTKAIRTIAKNGAYSTLRKAGLIK